MPTFEEMKFLETRSKTVPILVGSILAVALSLAYFYPLEAQGPFNPGRFTLRLASGSLTAGENTTPVTGMSGFKVCTVFLDVTTITTPDADDVVRFFIQTRYDGLNWTDIENVTFKTADDGTTAERIIIIDGAEDGPGANLSITGTDPAANAEVSEAVPANTIWRVNSMALTLVTDANAATRTVAVAIDDGSIVLLPYTSGTTQIESLTRNYILEPVSFVRTAVGTEIYIPIQGGLVLTSGSRIVTTTANIQATDNYGAPQLHVDAWHDPSRCTDGTMGDNLKSYDRPAGDRFRIKTLVEGATAPTYAYAAKIACK